MNPNSAWQRAVNFAADAHRHHTRKDGKTPYVAHVFRVALTLRHAFECDDQIALIAALLHDTIEDTTTDYDDINEEFGAEVAACVVAMSKNMLLPEPEREADYDRRLAQGPWQSRLIKLADVYDNLTDILVLRPDQACLKQMDRCRRAISIAQPDAHRPPFARALRVVEDAMRDADG